AGGEDVPGAVAGAEDGHVGLVVAVEVAVLERDVARDAPLPRERGTEAAGGGEDVPGAVEGAEDGHVGLAVAVEVAVLDGDVARLAPLARETAGVVGI